MHTSEWAILHADVASCIRAFCLLLWYRRPIALDSTLCIAKGDFFFPIFSIMNDERTTNNILMIFSRSISAQNRACVPYNSRVELKHRVFSLRMRFDVPICHRLNRKPSLPLFLLSNFYLKSHNLLIVANIRISHVSTPPFVRTNVRQPDDLSLALLHLNIHVLAFFFLSSVSFNSFSRIFGEQTYASTRVRSNVE